MAIKNWHFGKIILIWVCCLSLLLAFWLLWSTPGYRKNELLIPLVALHVTLAILVPITWKWLSGKEKKD